MLYSYLWYLPFVTMQRLTNVYGATDRKTCQFGDIEEVKPFLRRGVGNQMKSAFYILWAALRIQCGSVPRGH